MKATVEAPANGLQGEARPSLRDRLTQARDNAKQAAEEARMAMVANNGAMQAFDLALAMMNDG